MRKNKFSLFILLCVILLSACRSSIQNNIEELPSIEHAEIGITIAPTLAPSIASYNLVYEEATLVRVVDGDTLIVNINDGEYRLRMIGIDCPESVNPDESKNTEEGEESSNFTKALLEEGQLLYLTKDISDTDRYDRLLRYVWIGIPNESDIESNMVNAIILYNGFAIAKDYKPDIKYSKEFHSFQGEAEEQKRGIFN